MNFDAFYIHSHPTPATLLVACDKCQRAKWALDTPYTLYCCNSRMRRASADERTAACKTIKKVLKQSNITVVDGYDPSILIRK